MNTLRSPAIIFFIILTVTIQSCGQKIDHKEEVKYYSEMWLIGKQHIEGWNRMMDRFSSTRDIARQNEEEKIDQDLADNLTAAIDAYMLTVDSSLAKISTIKELDRRIDAVAQMRIYLSDSKEYASSDLKLVIKCLLKGLANRSEKEKMDMEISRDEEKRLIKENDRMYELMQKFAKKHDVMNSELEGLIH